MGNETFEDWALGNPPDAFDTHARYAKKAYAAGRLAQREEDAKIAEETTVTASGYYAGLYESGGEHCAEKIARAIREAGETKEAK